MSNFFNSKKILERINNKFEENLKKFNAKVSDIEFRMKTYPSCETVHEFDCFITLSLSFGKFDCSFVFEFETNNQEQNDNITALQLDVTFKIFDSDSEDVMSIAEFDYDGGFSVYEYDSQYELIIERDGEEEEDKIDPRWIELSKSMDSQEFDDFCNDIYEIVKEYVSDRFDFECVVEKIKSLKKV